MKETGRIVFFAMPITLRFDVNRMAQDIAAKGWQHGDIATRAEVATSTVSRFLGGRHQTIKTAKKLAGALGFSVRRYLVTRPISAAERRTAERRDGERRAADRRAEA